MQEITGIFILIIFLVALIAVQVAILRWVLKIDQRLYEAQKTNHLLKQLLDKLNPAKEE